MNRGVLIFLALVAVAISTPSPLWAQTPQNEEISQEELLQPSISTAKSGQGLYTVGKTLIYTGASFATLGGCMVLWDYITYEPSADTGYEDLNLLPAFGLLYGAIGAAIATLGLPIYIGGQHMGKKAGVAHSNIALPQKGWGGMIDLGVGMNPNYSIHGIYGYHFNQYIFAGLGVGFEREVAYSHPDNELPLFANIRLQWGNGRIAPYLGIKGGMNLLRNEYYYGVDVGSRVQCSSTDDGNDAWWISTSWACLLYTSPSPRD